MLPFSLRHRSIIAPWLALLAAVVLLVSLATPAEAAGAWTATGPMVNGHAWHAMTPLADGRVLVTGGSDGFPGIAAAEIFNAGYQQHYLQDQALARR